MSHPESATQYGATPKERFDQCIAMLKAYYDALEGRLAATVAFYVGIVGWLITSAAARDAIRSSQSLRYLAMVAILLMTSFFAMNVMRWVKRWREIRGTLDDLRYMEARYYARYDVPGWAPVAYIAPVVILCGVIVTFMILIGRGDIQR
jgi:hypothetical protein